MKRILAAMLFALVLCGTACSSSTASESVPESAGVPNPLVEVASVEEAEEAIGSDCKVPTVLPEGYVQQGMVTIDNSVLQIIYTKEDSELTYRTGPVSLNETEISGDYNQYASEVVKEISGAEVTLRGDESAGVWHSGFWDSDGMRYAFYSEAPLTSAEVEQLIAGLA